MTKPVGPYSPIVRSGDWVITSGQLGLADGTLVADDAPAQARQALANVAGLLATEGLDMTDVVKTTVYLVDIDDYPSVNEVYAGAFGDHRPARSAVAVAALPLGARVEVEAWARTRD